MTEKSRTEYSLINIATGIGGYIINLLMSFICRVIFTRTLGAEYLGINGLFTDILSMLSLTELGIGTAMIYALYKPVAEHNEALIASYMHIYGKAYKAVGIIVGIIGLAIMPFLKLIIRDIPSIPENIYLIYGLYLFSTASSYFFSYRSAVLIANQRNYIVVSISYFIVVIQNILQIIVLIASHNYLAYLIIQIICTLISNMLISKKAIHDYPYIGGRNAASLPKEAYSSLLKNIKAITVNKLSGILVNSTDNLVITYFNGLITTGLVSNYTLLTSTLNTFIQQIFSGITASVGNFNAVESEDQKFLVFKSLNLLNFWIYGWAAIGFFVLSNDIIAVLFGQEFVMPQSIPIILAINFYMLGMFSVTGLYRSTMGLFRHVQYVQFCTAILNLIGDIILGKKYGILGIYCATLIARLCTNAWYEPYVVYKHGLNRNPIEYLKRYTFYAALLIFTATVCYALGSLFSYSNVVSLIIKFIICVVIPNLFFFIAFRRLPEFQHLYSLGLQVTIKFADKIRALFKKEA